LINSRSFQRRESLQTPRWSIIRRHHYHKLVRLPSQFDL
jgi:hypothetical protein